MKVVSVVGTRPQFVKLAPIDAALRAAGDEHVIIATGQHYDTAMSDVFFTELGISPPAENLEVGSGSHGDQTGRMLQLLDPALAKHHPDWVLVYGDTNSTVAGALAAVKLQLPVAHLEAGLRSFNRAMPEEHNRVLTDHAADLCLAPTELGAAQLAKEGLKDRTVITGDVMTDICLEVAAKVRAADYRPVAGLTDDQYLVATIHRAENTDDPARLREILAALAALPRPVVLAAHPRLVAKADSFDIPLLTGSLQVIDPLNYTSMVALVDRASGVVTDSGGLQKEAFLLRTPCTTLRNETEWTETIELGWNVLCTDLASLTELVTRPTPAATDAAPYGDGHAAAAVVTALRERLS